MRVTSFDEAYSNILWQLLNCPDFVVPAGDIRDKQRVHGFREILGFQFKLTNIEDNTITHNKNRAFNLSYANDFFQYIVSDDATLIKNEKAKEYLVEFEGRNTQYGPRIFEQLGGVLTELSRDEHSRRGAILILEKGDQAVFNGKRSGQTSIEYPCTNSLVFSIRDGKLHLTSNMRSQSACMVMPYDIYNWTQLMKMVRDLLLPVYPDLKCGILTHQVASLHIYDNEIELARRILAEYGLLV